MRNALAFVLVLGLLSSAALARDAFAGTWNVTVTPDDPTANAGQKEFKDTFTFKGDQFSSKACKAHGFESAQYEEDTRYGLAATFKCTIKSKQKDQGTATWSGTATGANLTGELTWKKPDGTEYHYTFKGERP